jgi:hypothetical protein
MKHSPADDNPEAANFLSNVITHGIVFAIGILSIVIPQKCEKDHNHDKVLCKETQYESVIRGEKITYHPIKTEVNVQKK